MKCSGGCGHQVEKYGSAKVYCDDCIMELSKELRSSRVELWQKQAELKSRLKKLDLLPKK